ncbi:hypothetical protein AGOR_G00204310 [Albula goreensis]|uniref:Alkylated DNA repair protein AlkB homologue 8 N-terminal domain-containing protein n=1 Tax=Albula goreensis TaxID=1534307 RepID=A0A8T3CSK3_9TELE|nr:hypothetical protein AGOR_G00204310 [Albula goreensis]
MVAINKKAQRRMCFLCQLRTCNLSKELLCQFYRTVIESVLCTSITVWFCSATQKDKARLQRIVRTAEWILGINLPSLQDLYSSQVRKQAVKITEGPSHPGHSQSELLPSGWRYRSLSAKTSRHENNFFPQAVKLMNTHPGQGPKHTPSALSLCAILNS